MTQYSLNLGRQERDAGIKTVLVNAGDQWRDLVWNYVINLHHGTEVTGEDIRRACEARGIIPHHPNAWGGTINGLIRQGILIKTGRWVQMKDKRSHARATQLLRRFKLL
jgi:hypothetical protein